MAISPTSKLRRRYCHLRTLNLQNSFLDYHYYSTLHCSTKISHSARWTMVSPGGVFRKPYNLSDFYGMYSEAAQIGKPGLKERQKSHVSQYKRETSGTLRVSEEFSFGQRPESKDYCSDSGSRCSFPGMLPVSHTMQVLLQLLIDCMPHALFWPRACPELRSACQCCLLLIARCLIRLDCCFGELHEVFLVSCLYQFAKTMKTGKHTHSPDAGKASNQFTGRDPCISCILFRQIRGSLLCFICSDSGSPIQQQLVNCSVQLDLNKPAVLQAKSKMTERPFKYVSAPCFNLNSAAQMLCC